MAVPAAQVEMHWFGNGRGRRIEHVAAGGAGGNTLVGNGGAGGAGLVHLRVNIWKAL